MKKKVMCVLLTGMMAASMMAGCGNSSNTTNAETDAADAGYGTVLTGSQDKA